MGIDRQVAFRFCTFESFADCSLTRETTRKEILTNGLGRIATRKSTLHHETPFWISPISNYVDGASQQPFRDSPCIRFIECVLYEASLLLGVTIECLTKQFFLAAKSRIEARAVATAGFRRLVEIMAAQLGKLPPVTARRRALVAVSTMIGVLTMSRIVTNPELSAAILKEAEKSLSDG
jgi:hypothetical protein